MCVFSMSFMSDFDLMLARRKAMNSKKRRHRDGGTFISDADDVVSAMIIKMNEAAEVRLRLNKSLALHPPRRTVTHAVFLCVTGRSDVEQPQETRVEETDAAAAGCHAPEEVRT